MKMITTRKVLTLMLILSTFSFMGCGSGSRDEKAAKKILSSLQEKYGEEFVLDSIGGGWGTMNNNTLKAIVYPKKDETMRVKVEITKDLKEVYDKYLNQAVAKNEQGAIQKIANNIWPDSKVVIANDTKLVYPVHSDTNMTYEEFLELYPMNSQMVFIYLNYENYFDSNGDIDEEVEINKYLEFAEILARNKYLSSYIAMSYLTPEAYNRLEEAKQSNDTIDNFFSEEEKKTGSPNIVTMVDYELGKDGQIIESTEELHSLFELWKEKRLKSLEKRGGL